MIDLHTHSDQSDGSVSPADLVRQARDAGLEALGITDHDTLAGWDLAAPAATDLGIELVCGVEISTRIAPGSKRSVHLLGYFLADPPPRDFRDWLRNWQESRRRRNVELIAKLQSLGLDLRLEEAQALGGNLTGRPHFAQVMVRKGYVKTIQQAFDLYLADDAKAAVHRDQSSLIQGIERIRAAGGLASLPHPSRLAEARERNSLIALLKPLLRAGLDGIEVYCSEHTAAHIALFLSVARELRLAVTGGSDFHGANKPGIELGTGAGNNLDLPYSLLEALREHAAAR